MLEHPEWLEIDVKHVPWRVIEEVVPQQTWKRRDIDRMLNPHRRCMPFEEAQRWHQKRKGSGKVYSVKEHRETYAEVREGPNGQFHVYIHFGGTNENVTIDIDVLFLHSNMAYRIQQIVRATQLREIEEDDDDNPWGNLN